MLLWKQLGSYAEDGMRVCMSMCNGVLDYYLIPNSKPGKKWWDLIKVHKGTTLKKKNCVTHGRP